MFDNNPLKRNAGARKPHDGTVRTVCQECTVGCGILAYLKEGVIVDIQGDEDHPVSRGRLCAKGIAFPPGLAHPDRIRCVSQRKSLDDPHQPVDDWEKALDSVAEQLRKTKARYGPRSLMIGCDPDAGLDFYIGAMRFARLWGTPHVFHPFYAPGGMSAQQDHDFTGVSVPRCGEWVHSRCIVLIEADLATTHPVAFSWLLDARDRGAEVVVLDSRFTTTMSKADVALQIKPETGNKVGLALMKAMLEENLLGQTPGGQAFAEYERWRGSYELMPYEGFEEITGLSIEKVKELARRMAAGKVATLITGKRLAHRPSSGIWRTLAVAAGWNEMRGGGWYPLDAGLPGFTPNADIDAQDARGGPTEDDEGFGDDIEDSPEVSQSAERPVKALICSGNCLHDFMSPLRSVAGSSELNIAFCAFPNETVKVSHAVFPALQWPEKENLSFSNDRAIQWGNKVVEPLEGCRSGLDFWNGLAQRMADARHLEWKAYFPWRLEDGRADHRSFYGWLLQQSPHTAGCNPEQLAADGSKSATRPIAACTPIKEPGVYTPGRIEPLFAPPALIPPQQTEEAELFPLMFQATRVISRSGDAGVFLPWTKDLEDPDVVQIHPETAEALGIENGDEVLIHGPGGVIEARAWIIRMVPKGMIWSPRRLGSNRAVVHKKGESGEEAPQILSEFLK